MSSDAKLIKQAVIDTAVSAVAGAAATPIKALLQFTSAARLDRAIAEEKAQWLEQVTQENADRLRELEKKLEQVAPDKRPNATDASHLLAAADRVYAKTADHRKRKDLGRALVNAFDPKLYEEGMTLDLFKAMEDLTYPDIALLRSIASSENGIVRWQHFKQHGLERHQIRKLIAANLVYEMADYTVTQKVADGIQISELGTRLLALLSE